MLAGILCRTNYSVHSGQHQHNVAKVYMHELVMHWGVHKKEVT